MVRIRVGAFIWLLFLFCSLFASGQGGAGFSMPQGITEEDFVPGAIIIRIKPEFAAQVKTRAIGEVPAIEEVKADFGAVDLRRVFPHHQPPMLKHTALGEPLVDLSLIYELMLPDNRNLVEAINALYATGMVEYAEPRYIPQLLSVPNDPELPRQYALHNIRAFDAWALHRGDSTMVIGIVDTGNDRFHPDLIANIAYNYSDPINGLDDDNDGFVDNFFGWDLGENRSDPQFRVSRHGVHVSGIAAATANNQTGIAGVGWHSRFLPVKIDDHTGRLTRAYEGIVYVADRGASVINCSWGSTVGPGRFGLDIVNYATFNRNALVIAAAGNDNNQVPFFPASFPPVLSVAATNQTDVKWAGSSFNRFVDISAPGQEILSTFSPASYIVSSGTSMASPMVAGAAAIVRSRFPHLSARQTAAQLMVTADTINHLPGNSAFRGLLGSGRLNLHRAITETHHSFIDFLSPLEHADHYGLFKAGQRVFLISRFQSLLAPSAQITARLTSFNAHVSVVNPEIQLGAVQTGQIFDNASMPFIIELGGALPVNAEALFMVEFFNQHGHFAGREMFTLIFNLDYLNVNVNLISTTLTSRGNLGFNYPNLSQGQGFVFRSGQNSISVAGILAGTGVNNVVDNIYGSLAGTFSNAFVPLQTISRLGNPQLSDFEASGRFSDANAGVGTIGLVVDYRAFAWRNAPRDKFIILEYTFTNQSGRTLTEFYASYFADWVIPETRHHRAAFDEAHRLGYAFSAQGGRYTGVSLLSPGMLTHYAFDIPGSSGSINVRDGFTYFEKFQAMRNNRSTAGLFDDNNDVATMVSSGPHVLMEGQSLTVAFAILAGDHLPDLLSSAREALAWYRNLQPVGIEQPRGQAEGRQLIRAYPNPFQQNISVDLLPAASGRGRLTLLDLYGRVLHTMPVHGEAGRQQTVNMSLPELEPGVYIFRFELNGAMEYMKVQKAR